MQNYTLDNVSEEDKQRREEFRQAVEAATKGKGSVRKYMVPPTPEMVDKYNKWHSNPDNLKNSGTLTP